MSEERSVEVGQIWSRNDADTYDEKRYRKVERIESSTFAFLLTLGRRHCGDRWPLTRVRIRNGRLPGHKFERSAPDA